MSSFEIVNIYREFHFDLLSWNIAAPNLFPKNKLAIGVFKKLNELKSDQSRGIFFKIKKIQMLAATTYQGVHTEGLH